MRISELKMPNHPAMPGSTKMTNKEIEVMDMLGEIVNKFMLLPEEHSADKNDFVFHIHALQNIVLSREGLRVYKKIKETEA